MLHWSYIHPCQIKEEQNRTVTLKGSKKKKKKKKQKKKKQNKKKKKKKKKKIQHYQYFQKHYVTGNVVVELKCRL